MKYEEKYLHIIRQAANTYRLPLLKSGLKLDEPEVEVWNDSEETYCSEIRLKIYKDNVLHDSLEFELFRDGQCLLTVEEVNTWIYEQLSNLKNS